MNDVNEEAERRLEAVVRERMSGASDESVGIVLAMAGLLARVAYADRQYTTQEAARVREELRQVLGFSEPDVNAVCAALAEHIDTVGAGPIERYTDVLRGQLDVHMRADTVKVLVELAAADSEIAPAEERVIRAAARSLWVDEALLEALILRAHQMLRA